MAIGGSLKKEDLEEKLRKATEQIIQGFAIIEHFPSEIILLNGENLDLFKEILEDQLKGRYDFPVVVGNKKQSYEGCYVIDVAEYLKFFTEK